MTKYEAYRFLQEEGCGFVANVILTSHRNPASKLKGAARLVQRGHTVTLGATIDQLLIDGESTPWSCLEDAASARHAGADAAEGAHDATAVRVYGRDVERAGCRHPEESTGNRSTDHEGGDGIDPAREAGTEATPGGAS